MNEVLRTILEAAGLSRDEADRYFAACDARDTNPVALIAVLAREYADLHNPAPLLRVV